MTITQKLAELLARPVSDKDRQRASLLLLDWTGCAVAGQAEPAGQKITTAFPDEIGNCTRIGVTKSSPLMAALHNGCLGNVLEMDDVDKRAVLHAGPTVIPAALAMAEHIGASAKDFLDAIVVGYEATIRIGRAVGTGHYAFWHNTATCGPFGAAAAACHLLEESDLVSALGLAGTQAAGLWQTRHEPDSMAKQLHAGHAAHAGVLAAILSKQGFQGPHSILEGEQGFFAAMCQGANPEDVLIDPDTWWLLHETSLKPYPACRHAHPAIDAALKAWESTMPLGLDVIVETYPDALKFCDRPNPDTTIEAKFSIQHSVAVALAKGEPILSDFDVSSEISNFDEDRNFTGKKNERELISEIRQRVQVKESEEFGAVYPAHYGAAVIIGGQRFVAKDAYGDPEYPMSEEAVIHKAITLLTHVGMGEDKAKQLSRAALKGDLKPYLGLLP